MLGTVTNTADEIAPAPIEGLVPVISHGMQRLLSMELVVHASAELSFVLFETAVCVPVQDPLRA